MFLNVLYRNVSLKNGHTKNQTIRIIHYMVHRYNVPLTHSETEQVCAYIDPPLLCIEDWRYQIVPNKHNSIDVDNMDYLERDMFVMGLYSKVPVNRIISACV